MEVVVEDERAPAYDSISRKWLYNLIRNRTVTRKTIIQYVLNIPALNNISKKTEAAVKKNLSVFISQFNNKWMQSGRHADRFEEKNADWLRGAIKVNFNTRVVANNMNGRPKKDFEECSERSKLRKIKPILEKTTTGELSYATKVSLNISGNRDAATALKEMTQSSPTRATRIKKAYQTPTLSPVPYTPEKALALYVNARMTKNSYILIRKLAKSQQCHIYPSYDKLLEARKNCYPPMEHILVTEISAEINLQSLLDHTTKRLAIFQVDVLSQYLSENHKELTFIYKWGCDGSSNQHQYKQAFSDEFIGISDSDLFVISLVPLQLVSTSDKKMILWQNPVPSSTRFCRPIKLLMKKETPELTKSEISIIENQIKDLTTTSLIINRHEVKVSHKLLFTMVDGKVCSSLTNISAQKCYICGASPKEMNNPLSFSNKPPNTENYSFGLSTLHAYIRFLECLLHIAYRLDIKKWQVRSIEEKESVKIRKNEIKQRFRREMGLLVDQTKQGAGTTNDGNTARRFFRDPEHSARITGIDKNLISRFATILNAMSSGLPLNTDKFDVYTRETCDLYLNLYPWFYMPSSVHKILVHGASVIKHSLLPIGQLSEEAQESRNKDCRNFREKHTRKTSRKNTNEDLLHMLLIISDPIISQIIPIPRKKGAGISTAVRQLLLEPAFSNSNESSCDEESTSDSD